MHFSASRSLTQPLLDCIRILYLTLTQYPYDPGTLPSSANQCILGNEYLRSNLSRKAVDCRVRMKMAFAEEEAGQDCKACHGEIAATEGRDGWYPFGRKGYLPSNTEADWRPLAVPLEHLARAAGHAVHQLQ